MLKWLAAIALVSPLIWHTAPAIANDFPTQARVEYVLGCMSAAGARSYDTLYPCVCEVDRIASALSFSEYTQAETLTFLYRTPGERGGVFRDAAPDARKRVKQLAKLRESAKAACVVKNVSAAGTD